MNEHMNKLQQLLDIIDPEWIETNPETTLDLIECLVHELNQRKEVIEIQNESLLMANALLSGLKEEQK